MGEGGRSEGEGEGEREIERKEISESLIDLFTSPSSFTWLKLSVCPG